MKWGITSEPSSKQIAADGYDMSWIRDDNKGEGEGNMPHQWYNVLSAATPIEKAAELADAADVFLSYKEKKAVTLPELLAGGSLIGGITGAATAPKGKRLKRGLAGAALGPVAALPGAAAGSGPLLLAGPVLAGAAAGRIGTSKEKKAFAFLGPVRSVAQRVGTTMGRHPGLASSLRGAAEWGAAGGVGGALFAPEGKRGKSIFRGMVAGAAGGAAAPVAGRAMHKFLHPAVRAVKTAAPVVPPPELMHEFEVRSHRKYSPKRIPTVKQDVEEALSALKRKALGFRKVRQEIAVDPKRIFEKDAANIKVLKKVLPRVATDPASLAIIGGTAALFGISNYLAHKPRKGLGGKSKAQVKWEDVVKAQEAVGLKKDDKLSKKLQRRINVFRRDVSKDFAEHPRAAGVTTAALGAMMGGLLVGPEYARIMRGGK